ncbi:GNAT family N-acetyltransferase [Ruania zhangjianzhongii]|uniref:GNAT family N-acetyltransferase n=1 Tax=Ruania zhangjianzhongii TaxID=2603206 RepID=UPI001C9E1D1E|nr:GNAT family N-acetyltransferase [Ruania zhangjianzhongii]
MHATDVVIREYRDEDAAGWVRCRALSFLGSQYYDDMHPVRTVLAEGAIALVATAGEHVVGLLDIEIEGAEATIDSIATDPDHQGRGIATALLARALPLLEARGVGSLDAWTREDIAANGWYQANGFTEQFRYLHVYLGHDEDATGFATPEGLSRPVSAVMHGSIEDEAVLRARYRKVYVCRQYLRPLSPPAPLPT